MSQLPSEGYPHGQSREWNGQIAPFLLSYHLSRTLAIFCVIPHIPMSPSHKGSLFLLPASSVSLENHQNAAPGFFPDTIHRPPSPIFSGIRRRPAHRCLRNPPAAPSQPRRCWHCRSPGPRRSCHSPPVLLSPTRHSPRSLPDTCRKYRPPFRPPPFPLPCMRKQGGGHPLPRTGQDLCPPACAVPASPRQKPSGSYGRNAVPAWQRYPWHCGRWPGPAVRRPDAPPSPCSVQYGVLSQSPGRHHPL